LLLLKNRSRKKEKKNKLTILDEKNEKRLISSKLQRRITAIIQLGYSRGANTVFAGGEMAEHYF